MSGGKKKRVMGLYESDRQTASYNQSHMIQILCGRWKKKMMDPCESERQINYNKSHKIVVKNSIIKVVNLK